MDDRRATLARAVGEVLGGTGWTVMALPGSSGRTFVAEGPGRVVLRFVDAPAVLEHAGLIGVAPRVLGQGVLDGRSYVVQEHVESEVVDGAWIAANRGAVAGLLAALQGDARLAALALPLTPSSFVAQLRASSATGALPGAARLVDELASMTSDLDPAPLVASHGDPNASNFVGSRDALYLVDWDDLLRADPVRDLGQVAWWYLPEIDRPAFMAAAGSRWDDGVARRLTWWVAAESTDVALRLWPADRVAAAAFIRDAEAAIGGRPNPRRG